MSITRPATEVSSYGLTKLLVLNGPYAIVEQETIDWNEVSLVIDVIDGEKPCELPVLADRNWVAKCTDLTTGGDVSVTLEPSERDLLSISLPVGRHELQLVYSTNRFWMGAVVSVVSWTLLLMMAFWNWRRRS
jgi:hypothetical protein